MNGEPSRIAGWRTAYQRWTQAATAHGDCPTPAELWDARTNQLPLASRLEIIDHLGRCGRCARDWQLAQPWFSTGEAGTAHNANRHPQRRWLALAAGVLLSVAIVANQTFTAPEPVYRGAEELLDTTAPQTDGSSLEAAHFDLHWHATDQARHYELQLTTASFDLVHSSPEIAQAHYRVPEAALQALPPGTDLFWQVTTVMSDGSRRAGIVQRVRLR